MTSNLGSNYILENKDDSNDLVMQELRHTFKPEFINRIDEIIIFNALTKEVVYDILDKIIMEIEERLQDQKIKIELTNSARDFIIEASYDEAYGARPIKRYVSRNLETLLANSILMEQIHPNTTVTVDVEKNQLVLK